MGDVSDGAESLNAQIGSVTDRKNGNARAVVSLLQATSDWLAVEHPGLEVGDRDASLLFDDRDNGVAGQHDLGGQIGSFDSADQRRAGIECAPVWHSHRHSSVAHGHNDCRSIPLCDSGRKDNVGRAVPSAIKSRRRLDRIR
jgi:hypothetical protein